MALFKGIIFDKTNADIGWMNNQSAFYSHGYRTAAEKLINEYDKLGMPEKDAIVFPVIFLYRHCLEIEMKDLIYRTDRCSGNTPSEITHHELLKVWDELDNKYSKLSEYIYPDYNFSPIEDRKEIRGIIKEFNEIDGQSFTFRYPRNKKGNGSIKSIDYISLNNFKIEINRVLNVIDNINETICHYEVHLEEVSSA
ncbi:hypothetical protein HMY34_09035 [Thiothrix subterranea]|uniref:hypothetical protein n=1 Tax=Thiothrix subterranea TaxID=2735563 RepID=UPI00192B92F8|nr:hypothetical protein [Thiothrix subterranea]QQZ28886.1 hypothetical protein HMY34_09035 [Thiothrix subterranea]